MKVKRSFLIPLLLLVSLHAYIGVRLVPDLPVGTLGRALAAVLIVASGAAMTLGYFTRRSRRFGDAAVWAGFIAMGFFSTILVLTLLRDLVLLASTWTLSPSGAVQLTESSAVAVLVTALIVTAWGFINARRRARVVNVDVPIRGLPAALDGFSIVQISDIHVGPTIKSGYVSAIVDAVNELDADAVAITGDLVDGSVNDLGAHVAPLSRLRARHGVYFVTGNHEYYSGASAWVSELRRLGVKVLMNEHTVIDRNGAALVLAGVADYSAHHFEPTHRSDPQAALIGAPAGAGARVLLAHQPRTAVAAAAAGFDLQLSGHTHGGQFWPWNHFVRFQQPFTAGLDRLERLWVYTSRGTGYWGPPKRFGAPSEITRIRLVAGD
jgi:predicted MPP superfamily phosphohydrolase